LVLFFICVFALKDMNSPWSQFWSHYGFRLQRHEAHSRTLQINCIPFTRPDCVPIPKPRYWLLFSQNGKQRTAVSSQNIPCQGRRPDL